MNTTIERDLRNLLVVPDERLERLVAGVRSRIATERRRHGLIELAAAALLVVAATVLLRSDTPVDDGALTVITIERTDAVERVTSYSEPPGLGQIVEMSDLVLVGRVASIDDEQVQFEVEEILKGEELTRAKDLAVRREPRGWSCSGRLEWTEGERCLLCLNRDPELNRLVVTRDGSGKHPLPLAPFLGLDEIRTLFRGGTLPVRSIAQAIRADGPRAYWTATFHLAGFERTTMLHAEPLIQDEMRRWFESLDETTVIENDDLWPALSVIDAERLRALPPDAVRALQKRYGAVFDGVNGRFNAFRFLGPFCRIQDDWARDRMIEHLDAIASGSLKKVHWRYTTEGLRDLSFAAPDEARQRLWRHFETIPVKEEDERDRALRALLACDRETAERAIIDEIDLRRRASQPAPLLPLLECRGTEASEALLRTLGDPEFSITAHGEWPYYCESDRYDGVPRRAEPLFPRPLRAVIEERLRDVRQPVYRWVAWLRIRRFYSADPAGLESSFVEILRRCSSDPSDLRRVVIALRDWIDAGPSWLDPTDEEVKSLAAAMIRREGR